MLETAADRLWRTWIENKRKEKLKEL